MLENQLKPSEDMFNVNYSKHICKGLNMFQATEIATSVSL